MPWRLSTLLLLCAAQVTLAVPPSPRELAFRADAIVVAAPLEARRPERFKVLGQLKGAPLRVGQEVHVDGIAGYHRPGDEPAIAKIRQALLYLVRDRAAPLNPAEMRFLLLPAGVRYHTKDQQTWRPEPGTDPEAYRLVSQDSADWPKQLEQVAVDIMETNRLQFLGGLPIGSRRNQAVLEWLERHKHEFRPEPPALDRLPVLPGAALIVSEAPPTLGADEAGGWGELELLAFRWVLDSGILPDCWRAVEHYAEIHTGQCLAADHPAFASHAGRAYLANLASDDSQLDGARRRALRLLASPLILRPQPRWPNASPMDAAEQSELLDRLNRLLVVRSEATRAMAARAILEISRPLPGMTDHARRALPELVRTYRLERPGTARNALAQAVRQIGGAQHWKEVTGLTHGLAGLIQDLESRGEQLHFWLALDTGGLRVQQPPMLVMERLGFLNRVLERKTLPLPVPAALAVNWTTGWDGAVPLYVEASVTGLEPGAWRILVEGTAGPDKAPWRTEPRLIKIVPLNKSGPPQPGNPATQAKRLALVPVED